jgi:cell shape-determining protein MreC
MIYLRKSRKTKTQKGRRNQIIFVIILLFILITTGSYVKGFSQWINRPLQATKNFVTAPFDSATNYFASKKSLESQNKELLSENKKLKIELLTLNSLKSENEELKEILNYSDQNYNKAIAKVLNKPPASPFDTFVIDIGEDNSSEDLNLSIGKKVYYKNIIIGEIKEVYSKSSIVELYSSPNKNISVVIVGNETTASGQSNGTFKVSLPRDISIETGEPIFSSGDVVGVVSAIDFESSNTFQDIYFAFPFQLNEIDWVEILQ